MVGIHAMVHGNLVSDAVYKQGTEGKSGYIYFTVAVAKNKKDTFFVKVFSNSTETFASYLKKGTHVMVVGTLDAKIYISQTGGNSVDLTLSADHIDFGGSNKPAVVFDPNDDRPI